MDVTPRAPRGSLVLTGYGGGGFKLNHQFIQGSLLLLPDGSQPWAVSAAEALSLDSLSALEPCWGRLDLLIVGTGDRPVPVTQEIRSYVRAKGIALEVMDTGAACRTYNVLLSEGRRVAAALVAV